MQIWVRRLIINKPVFLNEQGPLLLACNHPNSFLDSVILDTLFNKPVWSLARGDVFKTAFHIRILTALKILPVYRVSEGVENLAGNYKTFEDCIAIFREEGVVTIFSEGKCVNEWHLRPLKKGTARLALKAWEENIPLKILPVGINYSSFRSFGKNIFLNFGEIITSDEINRKEPDGLQHQAFNKLLEQQLKQLVIEIPADGAKEELTVKLPYLKKILLSLPAMLGYLLHFPLYFPTRYFVWKKTHHNDHYDSVMIAILLFTYPLYVFILVTILWTITSSWWALSLFIILPLSAWACVQLKKQV